MTIAVIINPVAGAGARDPVDARVALAEEAIGRSGEPGSVIVAEREGHAREVAEAAADAGARLVVAWGGDGTVNEVACGVAFTDTALGIVAGGSGNGLARALAIPPPPAAALAAAIGGRRRRIDAGELDGRLFVNIAGVGFDARVARRFHQRSPGRRGPWPYVWLSLREAVSYRPVRYRISLDDETITVAALAIVLANGTQFGNGFLIAPHARLDDGRLEAVIPDARPLPAQLWRARHLLSGTPERAAGVIRRAVTTVTVETSSPMDCQVDGEPFVAGGRCLTGRVLPGAIVLQY